MNTQNHPQGVERMQLKRPLVYIDLETTGKDILKDRIVELAAIKELPNGELIHFKEGRLILNPLIPIESEATEVHGISNLDIKGCPTFKDIALELREFIGDADLCGFNSDAFDIPILRLEFSRANLSFSMEGRHTIDVFKIYLHYEKRTLKAAALKYLNKPHLSAHQALDDVLITRDVLKAQMALYGGLEAQNNEGEKVSGIPKEVVEISKTFGQFEATDPAGYFTHNEDGEVCFNFGKYKSCTFEDVVMEDPTYFQWIMDSDFHKDTKEFISRYFEDYGILGDW